MLRSFIIGAVSALALSASANAADIYGAEGGYKDGPYVPVATWTGFYVGAHLGGAWSSFSSFDVNRYEPAPDSRTVKFNSRGVFGGATLGYNIQRGGLVFGVEGDIGGMDLSKSQIINPLVLNDTTGKIDSGLYGDITGRLGFLASPNLLIYGKAGFAFYDGQFGIVDADPRGLTLRTGKTDTFTGWTAGGGIEYAYSAAWSVKAEYMHFEFDDQTISGVANNGSTFRFDVKDFGVNTLKVGLNYHVGSTYEPLK